MPPDRLIACGFHDELEALATLRQPCPIVYRDGNGATQSVGSRIVDVYAQGGADFIKLQTGVIIRTDHLLSVDDQAVLFANSPDACA